jgi:hypothetical protein
MLASVLDELETLRAAGNSVTIYTMKNGWTVEAYPHDRSKPVVAHGATLREALRLHRQKWASRHPASSIPPRPAA